MFSSAEMLDLSLAAAGALAALATLVFLSCAALFFDRLSAGRTRSIPGSLKRFFKRGGLPEFEFSCIDLAAAAAFCAAALASAGVSFSPEIAFEGARFSVAGSVSVSGMVFPIAMASLWAALTFLLAEERGPVTAHLALFLAASAAVAALLATAGTADLAAMAADQGELPWNWYAARQPLAFALLVLSASAAMRGPESRPASAAACVVKWSRYALVSSIAAVVAAAFLGGWQVPMLPAPAIDELFAGFMPVMAADIAVAAAGYAAMLVKALLVIALIAFVGRWFPWLSEGRFPRPGWRVILPLSLANLAATAGIIAVL